MFGERFTHRLEAFSDLVFGFSLSLLATRLDIPADSSQIFETTRWSTFIITFTIICVFWLAHYKIFRQHFVPEVPDVAINFIFLLGIAILPYALQIYLRFANDRNALVFYFGDFTLVFAALATLRWRALLQRRGDPEPGRRLREWRATVRRSRDAFAGSDSRAPDPTPSRAGRNSSCERRRLCPCVACAG